MATRWSHKSENMGSSPIPATPFSGIGCSLNIGKKGSQQDPFCFKLKRGWKFQPLLVRLVL